MPLITPMDTFLYDCTCCHTEHYKTIATNMLWLLSSSPQLDAKPWRRPLTMGHQSSEMKDQFQARPEAISRVIPHSGNPQPPTLADHFTEGPTKVQTVEVLFEG